MHTHTHTQAHTKEYQTISHMTTKPPPGLGQAWAATATVARESQPPREYYFQVQGPTLHGTYLQSEADLEKTNCLAVFH